VLIHAKEKLRTQQKNPKEMQMANQLFESIRILRHRERTPLCKWEAYSDNFPPLDGAGCS